jgi:DNA-binding IclR family transcriptional regulator
MDAAILVAVTRQPRPVVRTVAEAVGMSPSGVFNRLARLRRDGLVWWNDGEQGGLRSRLAVVAANPEDYPHARP